jgi:uncharacterized protein YoxC
MTLDSIKNKFYYVSFGLGIASTVALFVPNDNIKFAGNFGLGVTVASLITSEVTVGEGYNAIRDVIEKAEQSANYNVESLEKKLLQISLELDKKQKLTLELQALKPINEQLQREVRRLNSDVDSKREQLTTVEYEVQKLKNSLHEIGTFSTSQAFGIVQNTFRTAMKKLEAQVNALHRNYPDCQEDLDAVLLEIERMRTRFLAKLEEYERLETFEKSLDVGLELQELIINQCIDLRVKAQTIVIRFLDSIVRESVPFTDFETYINELTNKAAHELHQAQLQRENDVKSIAQEWVVSNNGHKERYQTDYTELLDTAKQAVNRLTEVETKLMELQKPLMMFGESTYANAANAIANYYYSRYQYLLDCITWEETETGYKILFAIRRNPGLTEKEIYADNSREQLAAFTNALHGTLPTFDFNRQNSTVALDVTLRRASKKQSNEKDVNKLWVPASKFEQTVKAWSRVRITGGSESGKSPTAENIAVCILKHRPGTAKLYNPQHDSVKNYWTVPVVGTSHKDSEKAIAALAKQVDARSNGQESRERFELSIFDEIDSTMSHTKGKKSAIGGDVNFIIKQASHQNLGAIFIGQNANVSEYPGMDRSDWNNAVNVHIGFNCYDAITNSNLFTTDEITRLKVIADKLTEFCSTKNEELGLDKTDTNSYRFAFVVEPGKKPYFIELPPFGTYTYSDLLTLETTGNETGMIGNDAGTSGNVREEPIQGKGSTSGNSHGNPGMCPHCGNSHFRVKQRSEKSTRYQCLKVECNKSFTVKHGQTNSNSLLIDK